MKSTLLTLFAFSISYGLMAQTPITRSDFETTIGTNFQINVANYVSQGEGGENVTWDFSTLQGLGATDLEITDISELPSGAEFEDANLVWDYVNASLYNIYNIDEDVLEVVGVYENQNSYYNYSDAQTIVSFPIEMGDAYSDDYSFVYSFTGALGVIIGDIIYEVDAYGTLELPWGTVSDAYRVKYAINQIEIYNGGQDTATYTGTSYSWFSAGYPSELMRITDGLLTISGEEIEDQSTQFISEFDLSMGIVETLDLKNFEVYPNPTKDYVTVKFEQYESDKLSLKVYDVQGSVLKQVNLPIQAGATVIQKVDISDLSAGYYLLVIESSKDVKTQKISKLR